jgi:YD repeat-containing protein
MPDIEYIWTDNHLTEERHSDGTRVLYQWDADNKDSLTSVRLRSGDVVEFTYHSDARLASKKLNDQTEYYNWWLTTCTVRDAHRKIATYFFNVWGGALNSIEVANGEIISVDANEGGDFVNAVNRIYKTVVDPSGVVSYRHLQNYSYNNYGEVTRVFDQNHRPTQQSPSCLFLFRSEYYDSLTKLYWLYHQKVWYNPALKKTLTGGDPPFPVSRRLDQSLEATHQRTVARVREIELNKIAAASANDDGLTRYGKYWQGVGNGAWKMGKEIFFIVVDLEGNAFEYVTDGWYTHTEFSGLGTALADPKISGGDMVVGMGKGIAALPGEWVEAMQYGDMSTVGEKSFDIVMVADGAAATTRLVAAAPRALRYTRGFASDTLAAVVKGHEKLAAESVRRLMDPRAPQMCGAVIGVSPVGDLAEFLKVFRQRRLVREVLELAQREYTLAYDALEGTLPRRELGCRAAATTENILDDFAQSRGLTRSRSQVLIKRRWGMETYRIADFFLGEQNLIIEFTTVPVDMSARGLARMSSRPVRFWDNGVWRIGEAYEIPQKYSQIVDMAASKRGVRVVVITPH